MSKPTYKQSFEDVLKALERMPTTKQYILWGLVVFLGLMAALMFFPIK